MTLEKKLDNRTAKHRTIIATRYVQIYIIVESNARLSTGSGMRNIVMSFVLGYSSTISVTCRPTVYSIQPLYKQES